MVNSSEDLLLKILDSIDYNDNKEAFVEEFIKNIHLQSLQDLIISLPPYKKEKLKTDLKTCFGDVYKAKSILSAYFSQLRIQDAIERASKNAMIEYIKTITPTLSFVQKQQLSKMFVELLPQSNQEASQEVKKQKLPEKN